MTRKEAESYRAKIEMAAALMSDEAALDSIELIAPWRIKEYVNAGDRRRFNGVLYRCIQAHTTQADWTPDITPALWVAVSIEEYPEWVQPTGAHDAYNIGDKVTHNGKTWVSDVDNNVWEPGVYGWKCINGG